MSRAGSSSPESIRTSYPRPQNLSFRRFPTTTITSGTDEPTTVLHKSIHPCCRRRRCFGDCGCRRLVAWQLPSFGVLSLRWLDPRIVVGTHQQQARAYWPGPRGELGPRIGLSCLHLTNLWRAEVETGAEFFKRPLKLSKPLSSPSPFPQNGGVEGENHREFFFETAPGSENSE